MGIPHVSSYYSARDLQDLIQEFEAKRNREQAQEAAICLLALAKSPAPL